MLDVLLPQKGVELQVTGWEEQVMRRETPTGPKQLLAKGARAGKPGGARGESSLLQSYSIVYSAVHGEICMNYPL